MGERTHLESSHATRLIWKCLWLPLACVPMCFALLSGCSKEHRESEGSEIHKSESHSALPSSERDDARDHESAGHRESDDEESGRSESGATAPIAATTKTCGACHKKELAQTPHVIAGVACVSCHGSTDAHLKNSETRPTKPNTREDCTKCHGSGAEGAPRIKANHGSAKACTGCHSIHSPRPR